MNKSWKLSLRINSLIIFVYMYGRSSPYKQSDINILYKQTKMNCSMIPNIQNAGSSLSVYRSSELITRTSIDQCHMHFSQNGTHHTWSQMKYYNSMLVKVFVCKCLYISFTRANRNLAMDTLKQIYQVYNLVFLFFFESLFP